MTVKQPVVKQPVRVVMFGTGPRLTHDVKQFLCRLEAHPDIEFLAAFCQSEAQTLWAIVKDLWRRRGVLALPLLLAWITSDILRLIVQPRAELKLNSKLAQISNRIQFVKDIHTHEVLDKVSSLTPDLGLIYGSPILKPNLFEIPCLGTLGIHHGKVPEYRGNKTTFWAMYNGEKVAGVTIQKINAGLDTGEIVKEGQVTIGHRSQRTVWRELEALGLDLYIQAILEVRSGTATYRPQPKIKGKVYRNPKPGDLLTFWGKQFKRRLSRS